jgi:hypothetical protein
MGLEFKMTLLSRLIQAERHPRMISIIIMLNKNPKHGVGGRKAEQRGKPGFKKKLGALKGLKIVEFKLIR